MQRAYISNCICYYKLKSLNKYLNKNNNILHLYIMIGIYSGYLIPIYILINSLFYLNKKLCIQFHIGIRFNIIDK